MKEPLVTISPIALRIFERGTTRYCSTKCELRSESGFSCRLGLCDPCEAVGGDFVPMLRPGTRCPMREGSTHEHNVVITIMDIQA